MKKVIRHIPIINRLANWFNKRLSRLTFTSSQDYWEDRYSRGGNSGEGSYGVLAIFKANYLNRFVKEHSIRTVIEFGCGDGNQLSLASYPLYVGLDVSRAAIHTCKHRFRGDETKSFFLYDPSCFIDHASIFRGELSLSLDVIFHLVEDQIYEAYLLHLFTAAEKYVVIYSSNFNEVHPAGHVKNRCFTQWVEQNIKDWEMVEKVPNIYPYNQKDQSGSWSDFYIFSRRATLGRLQV